MMDKVRNLLREQRGSVVIFYAIIFLTLWVPFVGLVIEYGRYLVLQSQLQNAADAAALSGAEVITVQNRKAWKEEYHVDKEYTVSSMTLIKNEANFNSQSFNEKSPAITWSYLKKLTQEEVADQTTLPLKRPAYTMTYGQEEILPDGAWTVEVMAEKIFLQNILNSPKVPTAEQQQAFGQWVSNSQAAARSIYCYYKNGTEKKADYYAVYLMRRMEVPILKYIGVQPVEVQAVSVAKVVEK